MTCELVKIGIVCCFLKSQKCGGYTYRNAHVCVCLLYMSHDDRISTLTLYKKVDIRSLSKYTEFFHNILLYTSFKLPSASSLSKIASSTFSCLFCVFFLNFILIIVMSIHYLSSSAESNSHYTCVCVCVFLLNTHTKAIGLSLLSFVITIW